MKTISNKRLRALVMAYLAENRLMTLAVSSGAKPWAATVFFAYNKNFQLYFFSRPDTRHCAAIAKNPRVAVAINQVWRGKKKGIQGVQLAGKARRVSKAAHQKAYALYRKRFSWADEFSADHTLYEITPSEVHFIDEEFFGHFYRVRII